MTLIPDAEASRAIDLILKAKRLSDEGHVASLDDALEALRDLEIWAAEFNAAVYEEMQEQIDAEEARLDAMFGVGQERYA